MKQTTISMSNKVDDAVLYVLKYYSLFRYPLTREEVFGNCSVPCTEDQTEQSLNKLRDAGIIFSHQGFYSTDSNIQALVAKRLKANGLADVKIRKAIRTGKLIAGFPFVRFIGISGSLSKGYADEKSDFDFFIITSENRLWICRTLLHLFKKFTFLFLQQDKFCMNYFLDISKLQLEEQNIYTAIELASLIPVAGYETYTELRRSNKWWLQNYLPNGYKAFFTPDGAPENDSMVKRGIESILNLAGAGLNSWLMELTDKRWRKKWKKRNYPEHDYGVAFKTTLYHSKNHPANYQKKILTRLNSL